MCWFQFSDTLYQTDRIVVCSLFAALWQVRNLNLSLSLSLLFCSTKYTSCCFKTSRRLVDDGEHQEEEEEE